MCWFYFIVGVDAMQNCLDFYTVEPHEKNNCATDFKYI
jgi:hypothetical protein